jgi:polyisoprenoid-binding protein YceI
MPKWNIDPDHTVAEFVVRHMMVCNVHGQFNQISGALNFDPANVAAASLDVEIGAAGLYTGIDRRDNHLRSPDFFDVEKYPKIIFKSRSMEQTGSNRCKATGDLTIHGVTRSVVLDVEWFGPSQFQDEDQLYTTMGFAATTSVNREDFGMTWNVVIEGGGLMVGKYAQITINSECDLAQGRD